MTIYRHLLLCALLVSGCVTTGAYDKKVSELEKLRADDNKAHAESERALQARIQELESELAAKSQTLLATVQERDELKKQLDDGTALVGELKSRLEKLGQNVDKLTGEKGQLAQGLEDAKNRLEELRRQKTAAETSAATFRKLVERLRSMIDAGKLQVVIRDGRMLIALPDAVLFDSGKTEVKTDGQGALVQVANVLSSIDDRDFLVAGHTDTNPIHTKEFPSNWELSTARAVKVTQFLIAHGMQPGVLAAAGYGEFDPVAANDTPEHRAQNRRIEIVLQPNLADLPSLDPAGSQLQAHASVP
ncbi:MAG TPA: OmpA family protein [Polyangiales bacterium]|nr:OmpA family protein [Polyangiales bacterium]